MPELPVPSAFGIWLRERRERALLTQQDLAALAGVNARTIRDLERGWIARPRAATQRLLTEALAGLGDPPQPGADAPARVARPKELPPKPFKFTGRAGALTELDTLLDSPGRDGTTAVITAVSGTAGVGKTALALAWAYRVAHRFPDGQVYLNLRGYDPQQPMSGADALAALLRSLGVEGPNVPLNVDERAKRYRSLVADRRMLLLLDNAHSVEQVRELLPGTSGCFVLITSRNGLAKLGMRYGAHRIELDLLPLPEAVALLSRLIGDRIDRDPETAAAIANACARLPLALRVAAEMAVDRPDASLTSLAEDLGDERRRLDRLDGHARDDPHDSIRAVFSWSLRHLSPRATEVFCLLGLHPGTDVDLHAAAALGGADLAEGRESVAELVRSGMLENLGDDRFRLHDLLRAYAAENAPVEETGAAREARTRLHDYYVGTAAAAADTTFPEESHLRPSVPELAYARSFEADKDAIGWLLAERANLVAIAGDAVKYGNFEHVRLLSSLCWRFLTNSCYHEDAAALHAHAVTAGQASGNRVAEAHALNNLASAVWSLDRFQEAIDYLERAAELDDGGEGEWRARNNLAGLYWFVGRQKDAVDSYERSLRLHVDTWDRPQEHFSHPNLTGPSERFGCTDDMIGHVERALVLTREFHDRAAEAFGCTVLSGMLRMRGQLDEALRHARRAHVAAMELGYRPADNTALNELARIYAGFGRYADALDQLSTALRQCRETVDRAGEGYTLALVGIVHTRQSRFAEASTFLQQALTLSRATRDRDLEVKTMNALGEWSLAQGIPDQAATYYDQAVTLTQSNGNRYERARALDGLGAVYRTRGLSELARKHRQQALELFSALGTTEASAPGDPPV